jgi:RNA polymerase sigma-70 factor, ECF subfamily
MPNFVSPSGAPSAMLIAQLRDRDDAAWHRLTEVMTPTIARWVRRGGVPESNTPDVVQDVFVEITRSLHRFECESPGRSFAGWVRVITRRRVFRYHRRDEPEAVGGSHTRWVLDHIPAFAADDDVTDHPNQEVVQRVLDEIRDQFEARTWAAFEAVSIRNRHVKEVAAELGMSVGAVYIAKSRVIKCVRVQLAEMLTGSVLP